MSDAMTIPRGLCQCGCGRPTTTPTRSTAKYGWVRGVPLLYAQGHNGAIKKRPDSKGAAPFKIDGDSCRFVALTRGDIAIVNAEDYEKLSKWNWQSTRGRRGPAYAVRSTHTKGVFVCHIMHRVIAGVSDDQLVDHINGNGFDNRRINLRFCSNSQNLHNRTFQKNNTSGFKGVTFKKHCGRWAARIKSNGREIHLGYFSDPKAAALAYNAAAVDLQGEFARLNEVPA